MTTLNALLLVANDAEAVERLESQFATAGLAEVIAAAAECDVVLTIATLDPVKHAEKTYARNAIIHSLRADSVPLVDRLLSAVGAQKLRPTLAKSPVGRLINSLSATDPSRTFARAYSRKPAKTAGHFDLVIASDTAAIRTAWLLNRRHRATAAFFGEAAAIVTLRESN